MKLSIGYINDVHGYLEAHNELFYKGSEEFVKIAGGYSRIATIFKDIQKENPNTLFFDGGDTFHGTLPLVQSKGETVIPILNQLNFSAMVGHWDFAYGPQQLKNLAAQLNYPVLGINVYKEDGSLFLQPYTIKKVENIKIAIIGICSNIIDKTMPKHFSEGLKITDGSAELPIIIEQVKEEGADIIILLSHNGFPQDVEMLSTIPGIDICLSAHTHNRLYEAVKINDTILIQCGCHGSFVGHLTVDIEQGKIVDHNYRLINVTEDIVVDEVVETMVIKIMQPYRDMQKEQVGTAEIILHRYNTLEASMDDLLLSAIQYAAKSEIAFSNGWRYGVPVNKGLITKWDLYNIIPMNAVISTVELSGEEIWRMLEGNLERTFSKEPLKQMGGYVKRCMGLQVKMRIENPKGNRIQEIYFNDMHLQKDRIYKTAFVTSQGVAEKFGKNRMDLKVKAVEAMELYLKENGTVKSFQNNSFSLV
jgi:sulfur-oxidizing protein SoxB